MRYPSQTYLVIDYGLPHGSFADPSEAREFADTVLGPTAQILSVHHWPAGMWRYGVEVADTNGDIPRAPDIDRVPAHPSPVVEAAHRRHMRANRRCRQAGLAATKEQAGYDRYVCELCGDRIL